ncbi:f2e24157-8dd7-4505-936f-959e878438f3 [Thermothielavioides terrestris]|uniref:non-specific serine/threonine protein kinase n=1 Tax=Thermothielavioides terrestris TaxID=2587410 RepID=A0A3S4C508_9PEZI|nr:f2e24157-8dd7-4505-936f-959e878438f3 [Thermothielavioides terrestris]
MASLPSRALTCHSRAVCSTVVLPHVAYSTLSQPRFLYRPLEDVERLEYYQPGGYHPVDIGDRFHGRYRIVHKLGHGTFSTIWLARDERLSKYVAIKVCTADASRREIGILSHLNDPAHGKAGRREEALTPTILDRFDVQGPNGTHLCYLHLGNILLQLPAGLDSLSAEQLYEKYGAPEPEPVVRRDGNPLPPGVPSHGVPPVWLGDRCERIRLCDAKLVLADFGVAFRPSSEQRYKSHTPLELRPPEARFEPSTPLSFPSDIWSLGCTIWSLLAHRSLFDVLLATEDDVTAQQIDVLGPLPDEWWDKWEARSKYFAENATPVEGRCVWSWERRFEQWIQEPRRDKGMATLDEKEREAFAAMVRWMLQFRPGDRPSAKEVLQTEWMRTWALPECEEIWS